MQRTPAAVLTGILMAAPLAAQETRPAADASRPVATRTGADAPDVAVIDGLPISLDRIRRKLAQAPATKTTGLRLEYYIEVYGTAPRLDLFAEFDLERGPVRYGGPTHDEILEIITPQEFRTPPADLTQIFIWLAERLGRKK